MAQRSGVTIELEMDQGALVRRYHFDNSNKLHSAAPQRWIDIGADYLVGPYRERYHIKSYRARWPELDFIMGPGVRPWGDGTGGGHACGSGHGGGAGDPAAVPGGDGRQPQPRRLQPVALGEGIAEADGLVPVYVGDGELVALPFGELPLWLVAPHLPRWLTLQYDLTCFSEGCYRFLRSDFPFVWIAANELPLREELLPFLVARSGKALDELALWAFDRSPLDWMIDMLRSTAVSDPVRDELLERFGPTDDPVVIERTRRMVRVFLRNDAELLRQVTAEVVKEDFDEVRLAEARALLGRLLVRRGLTPTADQQACIDACADLSTLHRWHDQAVTAASVDEALR